MIQYPNRCVIFADGAWPSNRWAVLGPEVSAQGTEFIITRSACVFAASIVRREKGELNYIFFFLTVSADLDRHLLYYIILYVQNMGFFIFCLQKIWVRIFFVFCLQKYSVFMFFLQEKGGGGGMDCVVVEIRRRRYNRQI